MVQTGGFDNGKCPVAIVQKNSPDATCMSIPYVTRGKDSGSRQR